MTSAIITRNPLIMDVYCARSVYNKYEHYVWAGRTSIRDVIAILKWHIWSEAVRRPVDVFLWRFISYHLDWERERERERERISNTIIKRIKTTVFLLTRIKGSFSFGGNFRHMSCALWTSFCLMNIHVRCELPCALWTSLCIVNFLLRGELPCALWT